MVWSCDLTELPPSILAFLDLPLAIGCGGKRLLIVVVVKD